MINIAVFVYDLINDYNFTVVSGICSYFKDKPDVRLIITPVNVPHSEEKRFDYQYWTSAELLRSQQIDGIIVIPNSFTNHMTLEALTEELKSYGDKAIVSVSVPLDLPNSMYTTNTCEVAYDQVIEHLKNKHNRKRIVFFGAGLIDSSESKDRFNAFKKALEKHNLEFYPELVFEGDFTPGTARDVLATKLKSKDDLNFDAICCVNDYTCGGCLLVFEALGIKSPEDVILFGFDDSDFSRKTFPALSSISQSFTVTGGKAAEMLYRTLRKEKTETVFATDSFPVYRQSCGCVDCKTYTKAYYDWKGNFHDYNEKDKDDEISAVKKHQDTLTSIYNIINLKYSKSSFENVADILMPAIALSHFPGMMVALYKEPLYIEKDDKIELPSTVKVQLGIDIDEDKVSVFPLGEGIDIPLKERIVPVEYERFRNGVYLIHPIFIRDKNYGYIFCRSTGEDYLLSSINLKIISDIIINAYELSMVQKQQQKLIENSVNLALKAKTDELTKVFNRRGILEYGQQLIDLSVAMNKYGSVFFFDLDGLKTINDTYGHKIGDLAIQTEAEVLKACFRDADLVGRLSGDEFCVIAPGFPPMKVEILREKLIINNKKFSEQAGLPFTLSISVGAVGFTPEANDLAALLQQADNELYEEKKIKHSKK